MDFLSFPAIDFDFLWSQHLTQVAPTTTPPKQPLATQQQPQSAEITELMANYSAKMDFLRFQAIDFNFLRSQHLTQVAPTTTPTKQPLATQQQPHTEGLLQKKLKIYKVFRNSQLFDLLTKMALARSCNQVASGCLGCAVVGVTQVKCRDHIKSKSMAGKLKKFIKVIISYSIFAKNQNIR